MIFRLAHKGKIRILQRRLAIRAVRKRAAVFSHRTQFCDMRIQIAVRVFIDCGKGRAQLIIVVRLVAFRTVFRTVIHARNAGHGKEQRIQIEQIVLIFQRGGGAFHVVIVDEIH